MNDLGNKLEEIVEAGARHARVASAVEIRRRGRRRRLLRGGGAALLCIALLAATVITQRAIVNGHRPVPSMSEPAAARMFECFGDGIPFPEPALRNRTGEERADDPAARTLAAFFKSGAPGAWELPRYGWRRLVTRTTDVLFEHDGVVNAAGSVTTVRVQDAKGGWRVVGYGPCTPRLVVNGFEVAPVTLDDRIAVTPASRSLPLAYDGQDGCTREHPTGERVDRFDHADIRESAGAITVVLYFRLPKFSNQNVLCANGQLAKNEVRRTLALPGPIGSRAVVDGSTLPPKVIWHP